jgi:RNA polymerase sigma factor (sigma-70 family)
MAGMRADDQLKEWDRFIHDGNLDSLSVVYFHFYDLLFTYGMKHTSDKQSVEDAIQDVFMTLIKSRKKIGIVQNQSGYLISSFRRQLFANLNKQKNIVVTNTLHTEHFEYLKSDDQDRTDGEISDQLNSIVHECIGKLPSKQQEIFFLRFENGISYEEIAGMLHISIDSCYKSVYRSIKTIRIEVRKKTDKSGNIILLFISDMKSKCFS